MQAGRDIPHPREQDNKHELEEMREGRGLLQRRLRTAFDDPTWSDLAFRCQWPPHDASTRAELLQGSGEEPSSPPSPPSPSPSPTRGPAAPELEVYVHRVVVAAWSDALAQLCQLHSNNKEEEAREGKVEQVAGEIRGGGGGDGDTTTQDRQQLKVLDVFEEEGEPTQRGSRRTVVELQATVPDDPSALRLLLAFLYSGDLAQALDDTAACRLDGSGAQSNAGSRALVRPHILRSILQDAAGGDDISPADRHTAKMVVARAANLGLGYGVPELHQQFKSSSMWMADTESSPTTPPYRTADDGRVESPLDALLAAASQHPLVRAGTIPAAESPSPIKLGGFQEGRSLRGSTERRVPARYCSPDVEVYKGTWEVRGKRKPAPVATSPSPASPTSFSPHTSPPTIGRRSARLMEQELTVAETTADVMAATKEREAADDDSEQDPDSGSSALDTPKMHSVARRSSRRHSGGLERKPLETDIRKKRRKEEVEEVDEEEEEDDDEYDQRHESMRIIANANKKRRAVAKAKQTRESAAAVPPPEDNADEETFTLVEANDHPTVDTTIVSAAKSLPVAVLVPRSATELASPRGVGDVAVDQPVVTETQVLAAAAASGQIRRSLKQLRKEHGKNCHNCKTRKIDFVTCLVRPTHRFCDGCLRKLFNVEFANAHAEWDGIVHPEGCAICRHMCPCVGCRKRAHPPPTAASPARNSSDASRKAKRPRDDADATDQHAPQRANGSGHYAAGSGDNDDSPRTKKHRDEKSEKNEKKEEKEKKKVKEEKQTSSSGSKRRRTRSLIDGRESTQENESEDRVRRSSLDMHEDEDSVEMMTDADSSEQLAAIPPGKSTRSRSRRRESAAAAAVTSPPPPSKSTRSSARRSGGGGASRSAAKGFNVPEGAGPEAFLGLVSAGSALSQRPTRRTPIRAPSADD